MVSLDISAKSSVEDLTCQSKFLVFSFWLILNHLDATGEAFIWTQVETDVGIICACFPTLKGFLGKLISKIPGNWSTASEAYNLDHMDNNGSGRRWIDNPKAAYGREIGGGSSQERIMSIRKTISVSIVQGNKDEGIHEYNHFPRREVV
jgi:hypothetical protein